MIPSAPIPAAMGSVVMQGRPRHGRAAPCDGYLLSGLRPLSSPSASASRMLVSAMMFCMR
jgi:hypothetical protein